MAKAVWREIKHLDLDTVKRWNRRNLRRCDPYFVWANATGRVSVGNQVETAVLVELRADDPVEAFIKRMNPDGIDPEQLQFLPDGFEPMMPTRFVTGLATRAGLATLVDGVVNRQIERFTLQVSRNDFARNLFLGYEALRSEHPGGIGGIDPWSIKQLVEPGGTPPSSGVYLGIIDDGLPFANVWDSISFSAKPAHLWDQGWMPLDRARSGAQPRVDFGRYWRQAWVWEPSTAIGMPLAPPRGFLYGRRLNALPGRGEGGAGALNERDLYTQSHYFYPPPRQTHGAGVLGLLAPWLAGARQAVAWPEHIAGLAMVQLPTRTVWDTSGGSLAVRVLDGLRFVLWQESNDRGNAQAPRPIVANVSYGVQAGPHDGTSLFERAMIEMLDANEHLHLVLPAGNAARTGCHARRVLAPHGTMGDQAEIGLRVLPDNGRDVFVEVWVPTGAEIRLKVRPPGGAEDFEIREGEARLHVEPEASHSNVPKTVHFGAIYPSEVAQGTQGTMILVVIGSTRRTSPDAWSGWLGHQDPRQKPCSSASPDKRDDAAIQACPGMWALTVCNQKPIEVTIDAWIERDDAPPFDPHGDRQARFPDSCVDAVRLSNATPEDTLSGIATFRHERLHVVGAMRSDGFLSSYSAAGPGRPPGSRDGPDAVTVADQTNSVPGVKTMGFVQGVVGRINGTSAACAVYGRALAIALAADPADLPSGPGPADIPPEFTCVPERQPEAEPASRGQQRRMLLPYDVFGCKRPVNPS